jgi:predicted PurR-regulated permease PerM
MFIHLITICIGLIIAFGLQQLVELFQRRRRNRKNKN